MLPELWSKKSLVNQTLQGAHGVVEALGCWRGRWYGLLGVSQVIGRGGHCCFVARVHENEKKPSKQKFTGLVVIP